MGKKKKNKSQLPFRLNILFFIIFLLFSSLIVQLGVVQILYGEDAQSEIDRTEHAVTKIPVPRGKMYDRNGKIIVDNEPLYSITYTPTKRISPVERLELATKLSKYITKNTKKVTTRDMKDYWILIHHEEAYNKLSEDENQTLTNNEQYQTVLDRITEVELSKITKQEENVIAIKRELDQAFSLTPHVVKNDNVTVQEYATVAVHLNELPGINVTTDWDRKYPFGFTYDQDMYTFRNFIGSITSSDKGLPFDRLDYFLARGYSRNDRVE